MRLIISAAALHFLASHSLLLAAWLWFGCCCPRPGQKAGTPRLPLKICPGPAGGLRRSNAAMQLFLLAAARPPSIPTAKAVITPRAGTNSAKFPGNLETGSCVALQPTGRVPAAMQDACRYSDRPLAFLARYVRR